MIEVEVERHIQEFIGNGSIDEQVEKINACKRILHRLSPFKDEPVDCVLWVKSDDVVANDYNPNKVAPPEMELLEVSIMHDGYTQPIVTWPRNEKLEVIDGFHRSRVGKESSVVRERVKGYLPTVEIRNEQAGKNDRIASTIRHNRARGKHQIDAMSEIVLELKNRNWTNNRIARELGMDEDEILRLCQITGLEHLFSDQDFSRAWEASDSIHSFDPITDSVADDVTVRTANTNDPSRKFYTFDKWECHKAGFYATKKQGMKSDECEAVFAKFLRDLDLFANTLRLVFQDWPNSCEHYLTNKAMNRLAWLGQAAVCYATGVPSIYSTAWQHLTEQEQASANDVALDALNSWLFLHGLPVVTIEEAVSIGRQVEIY
jgi:ParB-like chromosome segregation protein Spo0J